MMSVLFLLSALASQSPARARKIRIPKRNSKYDEVFQYRAGLKQIRHFSLQQQIASPSSQSNRHLRRKQPLYLEKKVRPQHATLQTRNQSLSDDANVKIRKLALGNLKVNKRKHESNIFREDTMIQFPTRARLILALALLSILTKR